MRPFRLFRKRQRSYQQAQLQKHKAQQVANNALRASRSLEEDDAFLFI